jgi:hypothetical protein
MGARRTRQFAPPADFDDYGDFAAAVAGAIGAG